MAMGMKRDESVDRWTNGKHCLFYSCHDPALLRTLVERVERGRISKERRRKAEIAKSIGRRKERKRHDLQEATGSGHGR